MKFRVLFIALLCAAFGVSAQSSNKSDKIHWVSFSEAIKQNQQTHKKIFVDVYTQWCGWCKRMDATTYEDPAIVAYMNKYFIAVKLDAEMRDTVKFKDKNYVFRPDYRSNEIAIYLLNGQMSYPTSVYLDETFSPLGPAPGYQTPEQLLPQLKYFAENIYKTKDWNVYQQEVFKQ